MASNPKSELTCQSLMERLNMFFANAGAAAGVPTPAYVAYVTDGAGGMDKEVLIGSVNKYAVGVAYAIGTGIVNATTGNFYRLTAAFTGTGLSVTIPTGTTTSADNGGTWTYVGVAATCPLAIIKVVPAPAAQSGLTDALGLTQRVYSPNVAKLLTDAGITDVTSRGELFTIMGEIFRIGMRTEMYSLDTQGKGGNKFLEDADIATANFVTAYQDLNWGGLASV